jgi:hypothetical protein
MLTQLPPAAVCRPVRPAAKHRREPGPADGLLSCPAPAILRHVDDLLQGYSSGRPGCAAGQQPGGRRGGDGGSAGKAGRGGSAGWASVTLNSIDTLIIMAGKATTNSYALRPCLLLLQLIADLVRRFKCIAPPATLDCLLGLSFPDVIAPLAAPGERLPSPCSPSALDLPVLCPRSPLNLLFRLASPRHVRSFGGRPRLHRPPLQTPTANSLFLLCHMLLPWCRRCGEEEEEAEEGAG